MKRVLVLCALVAQMAVPGGAEDPKPEEKKDPFRAFKVGDVEFKSTDPRLEFSDFRIAKDGNYYTIKANGKNVSDKNLSSVRLKFAYFDKDKRLVETGSMKFSTGGFSDQLPSRTAAGGEDILDKEIGASVAYWQAVLVIEK